MLDKARRVLLLRLAFWVGAMMDLVTAVDQFGSALLGNSWPLIRSGLSVPGDSSYQYAMLVAAIFMLAWTVLLIWADQKPLERRDIALLTAFPVVMGLLLSRIWAYLNHLIRSNEFAFTTIVQLLITSLFLAAYILSRPNIVKSDEGEI